MSDEVGVEEGEAGSDGTAPGGDESMVNVRVQLEFGIDWTRGQFEVHRASFCREESLVSIAKAFLG